ncbi:TraR/DksA family transcriptional regulator [Gracilimonas mengyeensis]|uniref:Transcriptional regulator, TraR/DksA family n=1 Tax=Gracilimonas mengyeensis TaxID=1302730 RepID=A0A521EIQ5_9BACT|nr:TraR/DksA C4-type zinc finger protein [Gracilimonas mengyeensis]SMO83341.1 transcriptional regulator, TraR/DksA family [Gracilimonas mengyeensis]
MTSSEKEKLKKVIDDQIVVLKEDIKELQELTKPIPLDASIGRISRMDAINNKTINEASLREKKKLLQRLEKAKERADTKDFGICTKCGNEIPYGRLEYMPHTTRCVQCVG